ncbi:protein of unknown function [Methylorubrum extorquens]|uniref:Uncharacterized protein n=1 Tax=Methylorubrum extorquens TaxID=408 RepID=A0A2N9ARW8_METEX|nr:protein of unknown function [Methylorubrum extorquens]
MSRASRLGREAVAYAANMTAQGPVLQTKQSERPAIAWIFCLPTGGNGEARTISSARPARPAGDARGGAGPGSGATPRA